MELTTKWGQNYDLIWPVQKVHKQLVWRTKMYMQCMPYPASAASHLKCLPRLFVSAYICMCCFYFSAAYVLMCFNFIYVLLCFVLCFYIWFWIAFRVIAGGNSLPGHCRRENSFSQFRILIQSWDGSECHCSACI